MEVEHAIKVFPLDADLEANIRKMNEEGWLLLPGVAPVAIYSVVRIKGMTTQPQTDGHAPVAKIEIDETKVHLVRDGQVVEET